MGTGHIHMSHIGHVEDKGQIAEDGTQVTVLGLLTDCHTVPVSLTTAVYRKEEISWLRVLKEPQGH